MQVSKNSRSLRGCRQVPLSLNFAQQMVPNAMTVDVEDWYQSTLDLCAEITDRVVTNTHQILDLFAEFNVKGTFFVLGLVCEKYPQLVTTIHEAGHEIATHGYSHQPCCRLSRQSFAEDVRKSVNLIQDVIGKKVLGYRAPDFSISLDSLWALEVLAENGIQYDSSIFPIPNPRYGIAKWYRFPHRLKFDSGHEIIEFPISTLRIFGLNFPFVGGGYSRLFPAWFIRFGIGQINRSSQAGIVYLHPYEIDCNEMEELEQVVTGATRLWQSFNRKTTRAKMRDLMSSLSFCTVKEILDLASG